MSKQLTYCFCCILFFITGCRRSELPDLRESFSARDTKPFGTYAAKKMISSVFPGKEINYTTKPFSKIFYEKTDTASLYINISRNLFLSEADNSAMLDFVFAGNTIIVSAATFDTAFLSGLFTSQMRIDLFVDMLKGYYKKTSVTLADGISPDSDSFYYYYRPFVNYFNTVNANNSRVLGYNEFGQPNFFILFWGKGKLMVHCDPRAFSNYFLLSNNNHKYLEQILSLTIKEPEKIYWDDYYRTRNFQERGERDFSTFSELMKHKPLATALWLFIFLLLFYVLFNRKRKQRVIPVIKKNQNSSVAFTETIARLYLQQKDNKNIAEKMITYFNEYIRNNYFMNANTYNEDLVSSLSRKSGVPHEEVKMIFDTVYDINSCLEVSDEQLLNLHNHIQNFYKKRN